jgi:hypothetical protein
MPKFDFYELKSTLVSEITKTVTSSVLGDGPAAKILSAAIGPAAKKLMVSKKATTLAKAIDELAEEVTDRTLEAYGRDPKPGRIGTAKSALHDFYKTLHAADLSIEHLISINLDPIRLTKELHECRPEYMKGASYHRQAIVDGTCREFAHAIMAIVPTLAEFQLYVTREVLERQEAMVISIQKLLEDK